MIWELRGTRKAERSSIVDISSRLLMRSSYKRVP